MPLKNRTRVRTDTIRKRNTVLKRMKRVDESENQRQIRLAKPGSLLPPEEMRPKFLHVYFLDSFAELRLLAGGVLGLNEQIIENITHCLHLHNHYVRELKTAKELIEEGNIEERKIVIREERRPQGEHSRRYNLQTAPEVAILMENEPTTNRDIIIRLKDDHLKRISELHPGYDPMQYSLLFPYGTDGYHIYIKERNGRKVTPQQYYSYHMMVRDGNYLLRGSRLFQQFLVDSYCKIETIACSSFAASSRPLERTTTPPYETE